MNNIGKEYSTALFSIAVENSVEKEIYDSLCFVRSTIKEYPEYLQLLSSSCICKEERIECLKKAFEENLDTFAFAFLAVLCNRGHFQSVMECIDEYESIFNAKQNKEKAKVTSVIPLTKAEKKRIEDKISEISKCFIEVEYKIDKSLLGGVVVEMNGKVWDGSVKQRLREVNGAIKK